MSKNGKGFEKFLREQTGQNVGPGGRGIMGQSKRSELGLTDKPEYIGSQFFTNRPEPGTKEAEAYAAGEKLLGAIQTNSPESEIESTARDARLSNMRANLGKQSRRISPSYWVTQADFQQAFNRPYNPMSKEDQRDFFQLVQNAPGATRRTDVAGADVGAVIPSTVRPTSLPKFQDIDGVKVPETAFSSAPSKEKSQGFGFQAPTAPSQVSGSGVLSGPKVKPDLSDEEYERRRQERISQKAREMLSREPAPAPEPPPAPEPKSLSDLELERMKRDAEEAPAPDRVVATLASEPISLEDLYKAWDPDGKIQAEQEAEFKEKETRENAPELATGELQKALGYYGKPTPEPKPEKAPSFYDYQNRMGTSPLDPQLNAAMAAFQGSGSFAKNLVQSADKQFQKGLQRINAKAAEIQKGRQGDKRFDVAEKGFGQYEGPPLTEPSGGKWEWNEELGAWSYNVGELPPTKISPETELDISKAVMPPEPQQAFAGVDVEGPPKSDAELSKMMRDAREASKKAKPSGPRGQSLQPVKPGEGYYVFDQTTQDWILVKGGKRTAGQAGSTQTPSFNAPQSRTVTAAPQQVANAISAGEQKKFNQASPITQEIASRLLSVQTPGQVSTQLSGKPLTTQERDRFKFDSGVPASVAAAMGRVTPVRTQLGGEPLTQTERSIAGGKKGEREMASFTKGMSDSEVNVEFEKIFGKENKDLPIEIKKEMIEKFRLAELVQDGGGIMGFNPMYEIEIDPDTGELKLNPKKKD